MHAALRAIDIVDVRDGGPARHAVEAAERARTLCRDCAAWTPFSSALLLTRNASEALPCPRCQVAQTRQLVSRFSSPSSEMGNFACAPSALS